MIYVNQINNLNPHIEETFKAFVEAIIPRTPELAEEYGEIQYYGALDFHTDEYLIQSLNAYDNSLALSISEMLDIAAKQLVFMKGNEMPLESSREVTFSALSASDRLLALYLLRQNQIALANLPIAFRSSTFNIVDDLIKLTMMGYYSEWYGYGTTRLNEPNQRRLEFYPFSWKQIEYPGPTPGNIFQSSINVMGVSI